MAAGERLCLGHAHRHGKLRRALIVRCLCPTQVGPWRLALKPREDGTDSNKLKMPTFMSFCLLSFICLLSLQSICGVGVFNSLALHPRRIVTALPSVHGVALVTEYLYLWYCCL